MTFSSEKISIFTVKISDDLFKVIDQVSEIFPFFSQIFRIFTMLNVVYDPFLTRKTPFLLCSYFHASDNTTSQTIGGTDAWAVPHLKLWGEPSFQSPLGLRPWVLSLNVGIVAVLWNKPITEIKLNAFDRMTFPKVPFSARCRETDASHTRKVSQLHLANFVFNRFGRNMPCLKLL